MVDSAGPELAAFILRRVGTGSPPWRRALRVGSLLLPGKGGMPAMEATHCLIAGQFAIRLGLGAEVRDPLQHVFERWDGKGSPAKLAGKQIAAAARIVVIADIVEAFRRAGGVEAGAEVAQRRAGGQFDPDLAAHVYENADALLGGLDETTGWEEAIAGEPALAGRLTDLQLDSALEAVADFADLKSPYTTGHSRGVAERAARGARLAGLGDAAADELRRAGLLHDVGRIGELASATGTVERYVREWLEQQAVAGLLTVANPDAEPSDRRYGLPPAHRPIFVEENDLNYLTPLARLAVGVLAPLDDLLGAFRGGAAVPYEAYGADVREGIAELNRPQFLNLLAGWLGSIPDVDARLRARPAARVADVACGSAWSSIAIARAYPGVTVDAIDVDPGSIEDARANVAAAGVADRVRAIAHDASDPQLPGRYDLITIFEALHDMNHPVQALRTARESLAPAGSVVIADERVADRFTAPGDEIERFNYGWSVLHCLTVGMLDEDSAGTGTAIRADTVRAYASAAGFSRVDELTIEHDFWRFYRLLQ